MSNQEIGDNYLKWFSKNYSLLKNKYRKFCLEHYYEFDEDVFSDTYLKIYESILRNGLLDVSEQGMDNYTFKAFKQNIRREKQYSRIAKRDFNVKSDDIDGLYEEWFNENKDSSMNKVRSDLFKDFAVLYLMERVERSFDAEHFYLFKLKMLIKDMTYKKLSEKTHIKGIRQKICVVKNWLKENVTKEEVLNAFHKLYGELL